MSNTTEIPKTIHFTWIDEHVPKHFALLMDTWKFHHPNWNFILWTDEMNKAFILQHFPHFFLRYDNYKHPIQKVDAVRYFILYHQGGVFVDLDLECLKNISPLIEGRTCVIGKEPEEHCTEHKRLVIITNAFMASTAEHSFFEKILNELCYSKRVKRPANAVLETTGPFMLTRLYESYEGHKVCVLDYTSLFPLTKSEIRHFLLEGTTPKTIKQKIEHAYAMHYYWGSWWENQNNLAMKEMLFQIKKQIG